MPKLLAIADDLTGANDVGVEFARRGIRVLVRPAVSAKTMSFADRLEVLVVSTESRHLDAATASDRVSEAVRLGAAAGATHFYKKTDSTMRGNIGAELEALLTATGCSLLPFIPAAPRLARTTLSGCQFVGERLLHESAFADDPIDPIRSSYIPTIIARQSRASVRVVEIAQLGQLEIKGGAACIYAFDATSDDDLLQIGAWLERNRLLAAVAGAAPFAGLLPQLLDFAREPLCAPRPGGPMLLVNGSLNAASLAQAACAEMEGFAAFTLPPESLVYDDESRASDGSRAFGEAIAGAKSAAAMGRDFLLRSIASGDQLDRCLQLGDRLGLRPKELHLRVAENLGRIVARLLDEARFKVMAVFGGDTLAAIARSMGWSGLWPRGEIIPGVVASAVEGNEEFLLLTKAGGFGPAGLLKQVKEHLRNS